jgi:hypothetical protein
MLVGLLTARFTFGSRLLRKLPKELVILNDALLYMPIIFRFSP